MSMLGLTTEQLEQETRERRAKQYRGNLRTGWLFIFVAIALLVFSFWSANWSMSEMYWPRWIGPGFALVFAIQRFVFARRWKKMM